MIISIYGLFDPRKPKRLCYIGKTLSEEYKKNISLGVRRSRNRKRVKTLSTEV